jgi:hypothetical protein
MFLHHAVAPRFADLAPGSSISRLLLFPAGISGDFRVVTCFLRFSEQFLGFFFQFLDEIFFVLDILFQGLIFRLHGFPLGSGGLNTGLELANQAFFISSVVLDFF